MHIFEYTFRHSFAKENFAIFNKQMTNIQLYDAHFKEVNKIRLLKKNAISIEINCKLQNSNIKQ